MFTRMRTVAGVWGVLLAAGGVAAQPEYDIVDLGVVNAADFGVQGFGVSDGGVACGRTLGVSNVAFTWTASGGQVVLPNLAGRPFGRADGVNDAGVAVGTGSTTSFGSSPLPLVWSGGAVSALVIPGGETAGRANDVNNFGVAVGSIGGGITEFAAVFDAGGVPGGSFVITSATRGGSTMRTAFAVTDGGLVAGIGTDPANAARNVGIVYDIATETAEDIGALPGRNGAIPFGASPAGHVVGSSMQNQGSGLPFVWTAGAGMIEIPLPAATSSGSGRDANSAGWVVGNAGGVFSVPWLWDGLQTFSLQDLIPPGSGWDLSMNTSSSAEGISEDGVIVGTGVFNGEVRGYALIPVKTGCPADTNGDGVVSPQDFNAWIQAFNGQTPACDQNGDGLCTPSDFNAWIQNFNAGC